MTSAASPFAVGAAGPASEDIGGNRSKAATSQTSLAHALPGATGYPAKVAAAVARPERDSAVTIARGCGTEDVTRGAYR